MPVLKGFHIILDAYENQVYAKMIVYDKYGEQGDKDAFAAFDFDDTSINSRIKGDNSILKQNTLTRNPKNDKQRIITFVDSHKNDIATIYVSKPHTGIELTWLHKLKELLVAQ